MNRKMVRLRIAVRLYNRIVCEYMDFEEAATGEHIMRALQKRKGPTHMFGSKLYMSFYKTLLMTSDVVATAVVAPVPVRVQQQYEFPRCEILTDAVLYRGRGGAAEKRRICD